MSYDSQAGLWIRHARSKSSFYEYLERPAMRSLLPKTLSGKSVLCLGVGSGEETEMYLQMGAKQIAGIDNSPRLIAAARQRYNAPEFIVMDMKNLDMAGRRFDVVVSSMALHYLEDWENLFNRVNALLRPGGLFVFSTHNPVWWSAEKIKTKSGFAWVVGVETDTKQHAQHVLGRYGQEGMMGGEIIKGLAVDYYHRPFAAMVQACIDSPLELVQIVEPKPIEPAKKIEPEFYRVMNEISIIACFKLRKPA